MQTEITLTNKTVYIVAHDNIVLFTMTLSNCKIVLIVGSTPNCQIVNVISSLYEVVMITMVIYSFDVWYTLCFQSIICVFILSVKCYYLFFIKYVNGNVEFQLLLICAIYTPWYVVNHSHTWNWLNVVASQYNK